MTELQPSGSDIVDDQGSDKPQGQNTTNGAFETLRRLFRCKHQGLFRYTCISFSLHSIL